MTALNFNVLFTRCDASREYKRKGRVRSTFDDEITAIVLILRKGGYNLSLMSVKNTSMCCRVS